MRNFSDILKEARKETVRLTQDTLDKYIKQFSKELPINVKKILAQCSKYGLLSAEGLDAIKKASRRAMPSVSAELGIPEREAYELQDLLKALKKDDVYLPQYQDEKHFEWLTTGRMSLDDLTLDLESTAGRNQVAKKYMGLVNFIVNKYVGQSKLGRDDLLSAGLEGLVNAMNTYDPKGKDGKVVSFKTYAGINIRNAITNDMTSSNTLSGANWYNTAKYGYSMFNALSLDNLGRGGDDEFDQDHLAALGVEDEEPKKYSEEGKMWQDFYKELERKFSQRDVDIFYRFFGVNGHRREKSKDIAASYGMSAGNIRNGVLNKMLKWIKENPKTSEIIGDLRDLYTESLLYDLYLAGSTTLLENLSNDDTYILLVEMSKWDNKSVFLSTLSNIKLSQVMKEILMGDFNTADAMLKKNYDEIVSFLVQMYPADNFKDMTDVDILEHISEVQKYIKKHKIKL